jgi:hypothetical protein
MMWLCAQSPPATWQASPCARSVGTYPQTSLCPMIPTSSRLDMPTTVTRGCVHDVAQHLRHLFVMLMPGGIRSATDYVAPDD